MNAHRINHFLSQISRDNEIGTQFLAGDTSLLEDYGLTQEEIEAVVNCNATKLYKAGVHPLLMMQLSILLNKDIMELYKQGL